MFDVARLLALGWALLVASRSRAWLELTVLAFASYLFALEVASGLTIRSEGPQEPLVAMLLALIGPTAMPRGHLPAALPLALPVVRWPAVVNLAVATLLVVPARKLLARIDELPQFSPATRHLGRVALALILVAVFEGVSAGTRVLPALLDRG
jgi:hypothetical protein